MKKIPNFLRNVVFAKLTFAIFLVVLLLGVFKSTSSDQIRQFSVSSTNGSPISWNGCEINPNNLLHTRLQIDGSITGLLSTGDRISLFESGSDSNIDFILEALGPSGEDRSRVALTLYPSGDYTSTYFLPLNNRKFNIELNLVRNSGRFSIGEEPNVFFKQIPLESRISCNTVRLPSTTATDLDTPRVEDGLARLSQTSSNSLMSRWFSIDLYIFFFLLALLGAVFSFSSIRQMKYSLPDDAQFIAVLSVQLAVAVPILWTISSYFDYDAFGSFMYKSDDGWCRSATEGLGDHCFGDWNERISPNFFDFQYPSFSSSLETSPVGPIWTSFLNHFTAFTTPKTALFFSLFTAFVVGFLTVRILTNLTLTKQIALFSLVFIGGYPWLVAVDRLHLSLFVLPFFALAVRGSIQNNRVLLGRSVVVLALYKPHFAILLLVFANTREWKFLFKYSFMAIGGVLALIALPSASPVHRVYQYVFNVVYMSDYRPSGTTAYPPNLSIRRMLEMVLSFSDLQVNQLFMFSIIVSCVGVFFTVILSPRDYFSSLLRFLPVVMFGVNGYVPGYYLLFSSIVLLVVISATVDVRRSILDALGQSRVALSIFLSALIVSQSLIILPYGETKFGGVLTLTPLLASGMWVVLAFFLIFLDAVRYFKPQSVGKLMSRHTNQKLK
jgi:hypothetical protein